MNEIFSQFYNQITAMVPNIISGLTVLLIFIILGKLFHKSIGTRIQKKWKDSIVSNFIAAASKWIFYILGVIIALNIIGFGGIASSIVAGAGISAIIFGFAFKDIGENFLSGILLALNRPFEIGDIIEVEGQKGTVKDLDLRTTHLRSVDGKDIYLPNSSIVKNTLINYTTDGFLRVNFMLGIAPENSIDDTRALIIDYLENNNVILEFPKPNVVVQELGEFTTDIQIFFWIDILANKDLPDSYLGHNIRSKVITDIKKILDTNGVEMPSQVLEHKMYRDHQFRLNK